MRLALWTPRPGAAWLDALLPRLRREVDLTLVAEAPASPPESDLDLYDVADDPAHGFVVRALLERPGLVLLSDWTLHRLVRAETAGRGDAGGYRAAARRSRGDTGAFIAGQDLAGRGGEALLSLVPLNEGVLDAALGVVALAEGVRSRVAARLPGRPVVHLPLLFLAEPAALPDRASARAALGVADAGCVVAVLSAPGPLARRVLAAVAETEPGVAVRDWPTDAGEASWLLAAADVAVAVEDPPGRALAASVVQAVAAGLPTLVSAGTLAAGDLPDGVAVHVSPGAAEAAQLEALVRRLVRDARLRDRVGALARTHAAERRTPGPVAARLLSLAGDLAPSAGPARAALAAARADEATPLGWAAGEVRWAAGELGLPSLPPGIEPLLEPLLRTGR